MFNYSCPSYSFSLHYDGLVVRTELNLSTVLLHNFPVPCFLITYSGDKLTIQQYGAIQLMNYQADIMYGPWINSTQARIFILLATVSILQIIVFITEIIISFS